MHTLEYPTWRGLHGSEGFATKYTLIVVAAAVRNAPSRRRPKKLSHNPR